jgi:hypothetical protein
VREERNSRASVAAASSNENIVESPCVECRFRMRAKSWTRYGRKLGIEQGESIDASA